MKRNSVTSQRRFSGVIPQKIASQYDLKNGEKIKEKKKVKKSQFSGLNSDSKLVLSFLYNPGTLAQTSQARTMTIPQTT